MGREALVLQMQNVRKVEMSDEVRRRNEWLNRMPSSDILVAEDVTLNDVHRWLKLAVANERTD